MKKSLAAAFVLLAVLAMAPTASAIIPCEFCEPWASPYERCIGSCNGQTVRYCVDYFFLGCTPLDLQSQNPLDSIFPKPFFLQPAPFAAGGATASTSCS